MAATTKAPAVGNVPAQAGTPAGPGNILANGVFTYTQIAALMKEIYGQATGRDVAAPINTAEFVSQADTVVRLSQNQLINALTNVMNRTIFSIRPYTPMYYSLMARDEKWGYLTKKLSPYDDDGPGVNPEYDIPEGTLAGTWDTHKPKVLQTVFMGGSTTMAQFDYYKNALDTAFNGPDELARFWEMCLTNFRNQRAQEFEGLGRFTLNNLMGAILNTGDDTRVIHLLREYNAATGLSLDQQTVMQQENFLAFMPWVYARIGVLQDSLRIRGYRYHSNPMGKYIPRDTPANRTKMFFSSIWGRQVENMGLSRIYNPDRLQIASTEQIPFWQDPANPMLLQVTPSTIDENGHTVVGTTVTQNNVLGLVMDEEAAFIGLINESVDPSPYDGRLKTWATFYHYTRRYANDMTENSVVLLLD